MILVKIFRHDGDDENAPTMVLRAAPRLETALPRTVVLVLFCSVTCKKKAIREKNTWGVFCDVEESTETHFIFAHGLWWYLTLFPQGEDETTDEHVCF